VACFYCVKVLCNVHYYCPCAEAAARRREVVLWAHLGREAPEASRGTSPTVPPAHLLPIVPIPPNLRWVLDDSISAGLPAVPVPARPLVAVSVFDLSSYDVSLLSPSHLFEVVNIPETLAQYDKEEEVVFQALVNTEPFPDTFTAL
jgi:hypothetical protein